MHRGKRHLDAKESSPSRPGKRQVRPPVLELVLKCDTAGSLEAVAAAVGECGHAGVEVRIIHAGVGTVYISDIHLAETGSRLIVGFNVEAPPKTVALSVEHGVEIRLYEVIYHLTADVRKIAASLFPREETDTIVGVAKVIALFKSERKGIILGCEVREGRLSVGSRFRVITAMGPQYSGRIESLQKDRVPVDTALPGQQVGLKIRDFKHAAIGDIVECYRPAGKPAAPAWTPRGGVIRNG